jgi:hypothetical protein
MDIRISPITHYGIFRATPKKRANWRLKSSRLDLVAFNLRRLCTKSGRDNFCFKKLFLWFAHARRAEKFSY